MQKNYYQPLYPGKASSETSFAVNFAALVIAFLVLVGCRFLGYTNYTYLFILFAVVITVSIAALEYLFYPKTSVLRQWKVIRKINWKRVIYKEEALLVTFAVIGLFYFLFPMFTRNDFTLKYFPFLKALVPWIVLGSFPYFCLMDKIDPDPEDAYYKIGYALTHLTKTMTRFELGNYVRSWIVKAFWLSLMQPAMIEKIQWVIRYNWNMMRGNPTEWFWTANVICFSIDLAYASVGYLVNLKILNSQTRTAEPTLFGWLVAIMCYWPFWGALFYPFFFEYEAQTWLKILPTESFVWWFCCVMIILLEFLYAIATISAGIRFSNVTYRGLWNTGLYRYTKHPAYVFKNLSWWFIALPFIRANGLYAFKCCCLLFGVNIIYYLRAKTEERHLSHYPEYVAYASEMNKRSIFRGVAKVLPFLKYTPPKQKDLIFKTSGACEKVLK